MTDEGELPEAIRKKLLEKKEQGADESALDEIDLDQVAGGAYLSFNGSGSWGVAKSKGPRKAR